MKSLIFIILLVFSTIFVNGQSYTTTQDLNIRNGAGTKYQTLGVVPKGSTLEILESKGTWSKINFRGIEGYISTKFLQTGTDESISNTNTISSGSSNFIVWLILGSVIIVLIIFRNSSVVSMLFKFVGGLFRLLFPEATDVLKGGGRTSKKRQVYCSKCGENKLTGVTKNDLWCSSGGKHNWVV